MKNQETVTISRESKGRMSQKEMVRFMQVQGIICNLVKRYKSAEDYMLINNVVEDIESLYIKELLTLDMLKRIDVLKNDNIQIKKDQPSFKHFVLGLYYKG